MARLRGELEVARGHDPSGELETIYQTAPVALAVFDRELRHLRVNEYLAQINGLPVAAHLGRTLRETAPTIAEEIEPLLRQVLTTGRPVTHRTLAGEPPRRPGHRTHVILHLYPILGPRGEVREVSVIAQDVTDLVNSESALQAANRQKDEFLAMLAHELRNPLTPIRNASELLARTLPDAPRMHESVAMIRRQVNQLARLVDDLLDVSRIAQGHIVLRDEPVSIDSVIEQAVETIQPILREQGHRFAFVRAGRPLYVRGDHARLVQSVANLLHNAAKYTDAGGDIRLEVALRDDMVVIEVADNGRGIGSDLLPHVFDLFVQSERTLDRSQGGLGIGLSVVKRLIEMHGGRVSAASAGLRCGSTFTLHLPRSGPPTQDAQVPELPSARPRRILIVDDNRDAADSLANLLALDGHEVQVVYDGPSALDVAIRRAPEVVFVDIGLPQMDGYEVARRLRAMPEVQPARLVALTGYGRPEDKAQAELAGFDRHLVKPVDLGALQKSLE